MVERAVAATTEIRPLSRSDDVEDFVATVCSPRYTSRYYGDTPRSVAERFLDKHFKPQSGPDSTTGAEIWVGVENDEPVGYYTMLFKRWRTAKASTFVVKEEHQGRGLGRAFHRTIEGAYDHRAGLRKLYHTAPVKEMGHLRLDLEFGYRIEGHLRQHFVPDCDELVMGRRPKVWKPEAAEHVPISMDLRPGSRTEVVEFEREPDADHPPILSQWLRATHESIDDAHAAHLLRPGPSRRVFAATAGRAPLGYLLFVRKRIKLAKMALALDPQAPDRSAAADLLQKGLDAAQAEGMRKLFVEIPDAAAELKALVRSLGFHQEATLESAYKDGVDLVLMSRFLRGGAG